MKIITYLSCIGACMLMSCNKQIDVDPVADFSVVAESATYRVGDPVIFNIMGSPHNISFYSGEIKNDYAYRNGRVVDSTRGAKLSFTSAVQAGTQADQLSVLVSTDFDGDYTDLDHIKTASWTDISSRFVYGTSATFLASTEQDLSDLVQPGKPLFIAFKYITRPQAVNGLVRTWMIQSVELKSTTLFNNAPLLLSDLRNAGFRIVDEDAVNTPARSLLTSTRITLRGNIYKDPADPIYDPNNPIYDPNNPIYDPDSELYNKNAVRPDFVPYDDTSPFNDPTRENWTVSTPIYTDKFDFGPDLAVPIKGLNSGDIQTYSYTYSKPGTYKAHFIASNHSIDGSTEVAREVTITITE